MQNCTCLALWLLFNHPIGTAGLRRSLSQELRERGCAYLTIAIDMQGRMSEAIGPQFANLRDELTAIAREVPPEVDIEIALSGKDDPLHG
jgi:hypothetical protein